MAKVLLVDDDIPVREYIWCYLEDWGHEVTEADNGPAAIALARQMLPGLIIMDINMSEPARFRIDESSQPSQRLRRR